MISVQSDKSKEWRYQPCLFCPHLRRLKNQRDEQALNRCECVRRVELVFVQHRSMPYGKIFLNFKQQHLCSYKLFTVFVTVSMTTLCACTMLCCTNEKPLLWTMLKCQGCGRVGWRDLSPGRHTRIQVLHPMHGYIKATKALSRSRIRKDTFSYWNGYEMYSMRFILVKVMERLWFLLCVNSNQFVKYWQNVI